MDQDEIKIVEEFKNIAGRFCTLVEALSQTDRNELLSHLYLILPDLIKGAASLPEVKSEADPEEDNFKPPPNARMRVAEWDELYKALKNKLAPNDIYWTVLDCWKTKEVHGESLADDIADIYRDLKEGICEDDLTDMVFDWRLSFYFHWGEHAVGALKAIHELIAEIRG